MCREELLIKSDLNSSTIFTLSSYFVDHLMPLNLNDIPLLTSTLVVTLCDDYNHIYLDYELVGTLVNFRLKRHYHDMIGGICIAGHHSNRGDTPLCDLGVQLFYLKVFAPT